MHKKILWSVFPSPHAVNVLDAVDAGSLCTPDGEKVTVTRRGLGFVAKRGGEEYETGSNGTMAAWLNAHEVGGTLI